MKEWIPLKKTVGAYTIKKKKPWSIVDDEKKRTFGQRLFRRG